MIVFRKFRPVACLTLLTLAACNEPAPQIRFDSPDSRACKAMLARAENAGCNIVIEFGPAAAGATGTREAAVRAWLATPGAATGVRETGPGRLCLVEPFDRDTDAAFEALKGAAGKGAGVMRACTDTGHSLEAQ